MKLQTLLVQLIPKLHCKPCYYIYKSYAALHTTWCGLHTSNFLHHPTCVPTLHEG